MSYNEYVVEYVPDSIVKDAKTNFKFIDASSPVDAANKVELLTQCVKIVDVKLCDDKYWSL